MTCLAQLKYGFFSFLLLTSSLFLSDADAQSRRPKAISNFRTSYYGHHHYDRFPENNTRPIRSDMGDHSKTWHGIGMYDQSHGGRSANYFPDDYGPYYYHNFSGHYFGQRRVGVNANFIPYIRSYSGLNFYSVPPASQIIDKPFSNSKRKFQTNPQEGMKHLTEQNRNRWKHLSKNQSEKLGSQSRNNRFVRNSTSSQKNLSLRYLSKGDNSLQQNDFRRAITHYKNSISAAPDQSKPHVHIALAHASLKNYSVAVHHLKKATNLDPTLPSTGESLVEIYGQSNQSELTKTKNGIVKWVEKDIKDEHRLFLLGFILHFDEKHDQASPVFEAAWLQSDEADYLVPFMDYYKDYKSSNQSASNPNKFEQQLTPSQSFNKSLTKVLPLPPLPADSLNKKAKRSPNRPFQKNEPEVIKNTSPTPADSKPIDSKKTESGPILIRPNS